MDLDGLKINFLGDSITAGVGVSDFANLYWRLLGSRDHCLVRANAISGTRIARQKEPSPEPLFDRYYRPRVSKMNPDADVIVVFGGTNDYGHGDAPFGAMEDRTDDTFCGALHLLYEEILTRYPSGQLIVMTPLHRESEKAGPNDWGRYQPHCLKDFVDAIKETAAYYSVPVVDLYSTSGMQPQERFLRERYNPDGLHPNDAGQYLIYKRLRAMLRVL